jgi:hypothetical protein
MKLISTLIAIAFASTLSFGAVAAQHMGAAPAAAPAATTEAAPAPAKATKAKKAKNPPKPKKAKKSKKAMTGDAAAN